MTIARTDTVNISGGRCKNIFANEASISTITPTNNHFSSPEKSRLLSVAIVAIMEKIAPVPPNASIISEEPFEKPMIKLSKRDSISPMKNVKLRSTKTPAVLFFVRSIANMNPNAIAKNADILIMGLVAENSEKPVTTPIHAPSTVGTIDNASSQYVLRSVELRASDTVIAPFRPKLYG